MIRPAAPSTTRRASEAGFFRDPVDPDAFGGIYDGTVGWDDEDDHFDTDESPDDQLRDITLVKVTLFEGRNADTDGALPTDGLAHGLKILARLNGPVTNIPPKGSQVHVSIPARRIRVPGAPVIIAAPGPQRVNPQDGDFVFWHPAGHAGIRIKKDGVFLVTSDDGTKDGKQISLGVSAKGGLELHHPLGRITYNDTGFHILTNSGARIDLGPFGAPGPLSALASVLKISAALVSIEGSGITMGTSSGSPEPWAKATTLLGVLSSISSALAAIATAVASGANAGGPVVSPDAPAMAAAVTTAASAVSAAALTLPSGSTQGT